MYIRDTHTHNPCLQDRTEGRSPVRDTHTTPAYKTAQRAGRRSGTHTHTHTQSLPRRPHRGQVAGQGHTHTHNPCLQDRTEGRSPVRDTHPPTRPHIGLVVGQGDTRYHLKSDELTTRFWPCPISSSSNTAAKNHTL